MLRIVSNLRRICARFGFSASVRRVFFRSRLQLSKICATQICCATMIYGRKKIGKLMKKYMKVEPVPNKPSSGIGRLSMSSRSSSRGSGRSSNGGGSDNNEDWDMDDAPVGDVPEGCLAVYVGPEMRRFVIQARFLYNQVFRELLRRSEEEYGFEIEGGLRIPCESGVFEKLLWQLETESF